MDIESQIKQQIASNPLLLYMKGTAQFPQCGFSAQVAHILKECGATFSYINVLENPDIRATLPQVAKWPTFPQLYLNGELLGGCDIVTEMFEAGELQLALQGAGLAGEKSQASAAEL